MSAADIKPIKSIFLIGLIWLFHISGLVGILLGMAEWFLEKTALNLLACFLILVAAWPLKQFKQALIVYIFFAAGLFVEWLGVHYGFPFGNYDYGDNLGIKLDEVPLLIGVNWAMLVLITGSISSEFTNNLFLKVLLGASLMVLLDFFIEPNSARLDFWYWEGDHIPLSNYIGWFVVAALLHWIFQVTIRKLDFVFSLNLYLAQLVFFSCLYVESFF
ncbi:MAG: carotenoid biosynthesis protein [Ekhidna sp.]|nr:carotenoid biosynthesis protein [Ekhidna sp.]MBC6410959.1 carotenoid biosynthesis protein [Ekhidna sp.]